MITKYITILALSVFMLGSPVFITGCGSACEDLADKICKCQPTRIKEDTCRISIDAAKKNLDVTSEQEDVCQEILDSGDCTCEALAAGDYEACGLANDAEQSYQ